MARGCVVWIGLRTAAAVWAVRPHRLEPDGLMPETKQDIVRDGANRNTKALGGGLPASLDNIRARIDAVDGQICDLIRERTALAREVGAAKRSQGNSRPMRPAREAEIIRAMVARMGAEVPVVSVTRIWRELIASTIEAHQGGLTVLVGGQGELWDVSREHFGSAPKLDACPDMPVILRRMRENLHTVAVMPNPKDDDPAPWWAQMLDVDGPQPRVIARLPFIQPATPRLTDVGALAVAAGAEPEPSGDDRTLLIVQFDRDYSRASVVEGMRDAGWTIRDLMSWRAPEDSAINLLLVELDDYVALDDRRLADVVGSSRGHLQRIIHFGGYPTPISDARTASADMDRRRGGWNDGDG